MREGIGKTMNDELEQVTFDDPRIHHETLDAFEEETDG